MLKVKVNGSPVEIETSWDELSLRKYLNLLTARNDTAEVLSVLLQRDADEIRVARFEGGINDIIRAIQFINTTPIVDPIPKKVGDYPIPQKIVLESVMQEELLKKEINKAAESKDLTFQTKQLAKYAAIYCQPMKGEDFDEEKADWLAEQFLDYPCLEVMNAGNFFISNYKSLTSGLPVSYLRKNIAQKKSRLDLQSFLRRSGFTRLWTISRAIWASLTKKR